MTAEELLERARVAVARILERKEKIGRSGALSEALWQYSAGMQAGAIEVLKAIDLGQSGWTISDGLLGKPHSSAVEAALNPPISPLPDKTGGSEWSPPVVGQEIDVAVPGHPRRWTRAVIRTVGEVGLTYAVGVLRGELAFGEEGEGWRRGPPVAPKKSP